MSAENPKLKRLQEMRVRHNQSDIDALIPLDSTDLADFERIISVTVAGGDTERDMFCDAGGLDIAELLLAEVKRLRSLL